MMKDQITIVVLGAVLCVSLIAVATFAFARANERERDAIPFFSLALRAAYVTEIVVVKNDRYLVDRGVIRTDAHLSQHQTFQILNTAYALALTRRNPILGIEGTDPDALARAVEKLEEAARMLAAAQKSKEDREKISTLYPIRFLYSLATLEKARKQFLASGSSAEYALYARILQKTIRVGSHDIEAFQRDFYDVIGTSSPRFPMFGGMISGRAMSSTIDGIRSDFQTFPKLQGTRDQCLMGNVTACGTNDFALSIIARPDDGSPPPLAAETTSLLRAAHRYEGGESTVILEQSTCLAELLGPYAFWLRTDAESPIGSANFVNDLYFIPTSRARYAKSANTLSYLASLGISYSLVNPMTFYLCPGVAWDFAAMQATIATHELAKSVADHSLGQAAETQNVYAESKARAFLQEAISAVKDGSSPLSMNDQHLVESLTLMFDRGIALDPLVLRIATITRGSVHLAEAGIPFDITARKLFLSHSALPSLFAMQRHQTTDNERSIYENDGNTLSLLLSERARYSDLRETIPAEKLRNDISAFIDFEKEGQSPD